MKKSLVSILLFTACAAHAQGLMKGVGGASSSEGGEKQTSSGAFDEDHKYMFYAGADLQNSTLSVSNSQSFGGLAADRFHSKFWDMRAGYRLFKVIGVEAHFGFPDQDANGASHYKVRDYYGLFAVPTANVFDLFELAFPLGYTNSGVTALVNNSPVDKHLNSMAYGARIELPVRVFWHELPDVRITGGGMVYYQRSDAREYGFHFGLRYDFGFGTPSG